ncbi:MAG: hypothetical protein H7Y11_05285 [Armatimonadetes bacterium]|nr:hypothetical protein [Anaerolineae bacterium]
MIESIKRNLTWRAIPIAGLVAGTAFLLVGVLPMLPVLQVNGAVMLSYMASLVLGSSAVTDSSTGVLLTGIVVHYVLSILFAFVIAVVVHRWGLVVGIALGAVMGLALYGINLYTMTRIFDWFPAVNSPLLLLSHVMYGAVAGGVYELFDHYDTPLTQEPVL